MKISLPITLSLILISGVVRGQYSGFGQGTITKKDSTSIKCYVELKLTYGPQVSYKMSSDGRKLSLTSTEIKSILTPYQYFENITIDNQERLMLLMDDGRAKLFSHVSINSDKTKREHSSERSLKNRVTVVYVVEKDGTYIQLKKDDYKEKLSELFHDQPDLVAQINNDDVKFENLEKIILHYNDLVKIQALKRQITARVVDAETKKPIKDAHVVIRGTTLETSTNYLGFFQFTIYPAEMLIITHPEYEPGLVKIPKANDFQIELTRASIKKE